MTNEAGKRLREAIRYWGRSISDLSEELEKRGIPGASRPTVHRYLAGTRAPSVRWLLAVAEITGVRREWLAAEQGEMTAEKERVRVAAASMTTVATPWPLGDLDLTGYPLQKPTSEAVGELLQSINEALDLTAPDGVPPWSSGVIELWKRLAISGESLDKTNAQRIAEALRAPLTALGVHPETMHRGGDLTLYVAAMLPALLVAAGEVERQFLEADSAEI